jgi:hypothetical protein
MSYMSPPLDLTRIADALDSLHVEIEDVGGALCSDMKIAAALMEELQAIDKIAQHIRSIASVLRAEDHHEAIAAIGVEDLRLRLISDQGHPLL